MSAATAAAVPASAGPTVRVSPQASVGTRRALRVDGRTPARGATVVPAATAPAARATHRAGSSSPAPGSATNRAERRRARAPRRSATRVAQGAVAVGLALGVGAFALTPVAADRLDVAETTATPAPDATGQGVSTPLSADVVQARQDAVVLASSTVRDAGSAQADAVASSVPAESVAALTTAVAELDTLIATTQSEQPALTALQPAVAPVPVLSGEALASAVAAAGADAQADAAAAAGAATTADEVGSATAAPSPSASATSAGSDDAAVEDPAAARLTAQVARVATLTAQLQVVTQQTQEAAAAAAAAAEAARKEAQRTSLDSYSNGQIPASALCELDFAPGQQLRCDAAEALERLNTSFAAAFGTDLVITDSYRSYSQQVACRRQKGSLCATPGTSNHGGGVAVDLGGNAYSFGTDQHDWMLAHAEEFGWTLPSWARSTGSKPEPWHWEFVG